MSAESDLREVEAQFVVAGERAAEKRRHWRALTKGAWTKGEAYEAFVVASIAYASAADQEAELAEAMREAMIEAQAEQIRRERGRQPEFGGMAS